MQQSASYQAGNTLVLVTYDEGSGNDSRPGRTARTKRLISDHQWRQRAPGLLPRTAFRGLPLHARRHADATFFDHYSLTKTVEDLFGLPHLAHAADAQTTSLLGHFGIS